MKIVQVVGARPQFIKYYPVSLAIEKYNKSSAGAVENILIHTGQHYDYTMSEIFFAELGIKRPEYHLGVGSGPHGEQTGQILQKAEEVLIRERPDVLVVYGDTNSTLGGALAGAKLHIPVAHIEAGLRSFNRYMPEELNRVLTDHSSSMLFCPTEYAVKNLYNEGFISVVNEGKLTDKSLDVSYEADINNPMVFNVGDVMYDVLLSAVTVATEKSGILKKLRLSKKGYVVLTIHRAENTNINSNLDDIVEFVNEVSNGSPVIFTVHPRTKKILEAARKSFADNVIFIDPVGYFDMIWLIKNSALILTDSGGMQKEAFWLKVPCITLRDKTEWPETVRSGWNILYQDYKGPHQPVDSDELLYGDGNTAERIVDIILKGFGKEKV